MTLSDNLEKFEGYWLLIGRANLDTCPENARYISNR